MSSVVRSKRRIRAGILGTVAGATVLGLAIAGVGSASASTSWILGFVNASVPAGTGSVKIDFGTNAFACAVGPFTSGFQTTTRAHAFAGQGFNLTPYGDTQCQGVTTGTGVAYRFNVNDDQVETGFDCPQLSVGVSWSEHHFLSCGAH